MLYCPCVAVEFDIDVYLAIHISKILFFFVFVVQIEKMEQMKKERQENRLLCCCRPLPMKWNILMTGKNLMLLGNVRNAVSLLLDNQII